MTSKHPHPKTGNDQVCNCGRKSRRRARICKSCRDAGRMREAPSSRPILPGDRKRKKEDNATISDSESVETNCPTPSKVMSHAPDDAPPSPVPKKRRTSKQPLSKPLESKRNAPPTQQSKSSDDCGICGDRRDRRPWKNKLGGGSTDIWVQCEIKTCRLWYHLSCVCVLLSKDPEHMLFCPATSLNHALFICPKCLDQPKKGYDKAVSQAMKTFISTIERLKNQTILEEESSPECSIQVDSAPQDENDDQTTKEAANNLKPGEDEFEPVREENYNGFNEDTVKGLVRNLHQSIYDYTIQIQKTIGRFTKDSDLQIHKPLGAWNLFDVNECIATGEPWFRIDNLGSKQPTYHAPITNALRSMLGTSDDKPLAISSNLRSLTFSQVHIGLAAWFVFDVLYNETNMYELPNMKSMRAMMAAVMSSGEARWRGKGQHLLREVQLRTWYKSDFKKTLHLNDEHFTQKLEAFMEPLTKDFDKINSWSLGRKDIIVVTLQLWSYLQSLQGRLVMIQPDIGGAFDPKLHEAYDQEGAQQYPEKNSEKKVLWVLCRGFQYEEDGMEDTRVITIKARVVV